MGCVPSKSQRPPQTHHTTYSTPAPVQPIPGPVYTSYQQHDWLPWIAGCSTSNIESRFALSSLSIRLLNGHVLIAQCRTREGRLAHSFLNLSHGQQTTGTGTGLVDNRDVTGSLKMIGNENGMLVHRINGSGVNFDQSSRFIRLNGSILEAECRTMQGYWVFSSIDLNSFIGNENGQLKYQCLGPSVIHVHPGAHYEGANGWNLVLQHAREHEEAHHIARQKLPEHERAKNHPHQPSQQHPPIGQAHGQPQPQHMHPPGQQQPQHMSPQGQQQPQHMSPQGQQHMHPQGQQQQLQHQSSIPQHHIAPQQQQHQPQHAPNPAKAPVSAPAAKGKPPGKK